MSTSVKLGRELLCTVGLSTLDVRAAEQLLSVIRERLETAVGEALARDLTDQQLTEFEALMVARDEPGALLWLQHNKPGYKAVVRQRYEAVIEQLRDEAPAILAAFQEQIQAAS